MISDDEKTLTQRMLTVTMAHEEAISGPSTVCRQKGAKTMLDALKPLFRITGCCTFIVCVLLFTPPAALADKTSVSINAPASAAPGSEITIRVTATHSANNFLHYTDWLRIMVNGTEIARWDYTRMHKPESNVFTREIKFVVNEALELKAEGHCNMHGSKGPATANVALAPAAE